MSTEVQQNESAGGLTLAFLACDRPTVDLGPVEDLAQLLLEEVNGSPPLIESIAEQHIQGANGTHVQGVLEPMLRSHGFALERTGLFADVEVPGLRPDLFHEQLGVIGEFERGGTLTNNRDLLDFYKVHVCAHARHLFLFVPRWIHGRHASEAAEKRMRAVLRQQAAVDSVAVFGY